MTDTDKTNDAIIMNSVFKSIGLVIANVDNCPIELTGIRLTKCYDSKLGI